MDRTPVDKLSIEKTILQCSVSNHYLVFIPNGGYSFAGSFRFQCLVGEVSVAGYTMKSAPFDEQNFLPFTVHNKAQIPMVFTPTLTSNSNGENAGDSEALFHRIRMIMEGTANDFKSYSHYPAVILVDIEPSFAESYLINRIGDYRKPLDKFKYHKVAGDCYIVQGLKQPGNVLQELSLHIPNSTLVHEAIDHTRTSGTTIMVTGNKDVGKSTLVRYMINHILSSTNSNVYLLDTDIGQTEFTPPGCVSLIRTDSPILTPPFLHQKLNFPSTFCIGSLSPAGQDFDNYLLSIQHLVREFANITDPKKLLIVNTHGWVEDFGEVIMKKLLTIVRPTTIFNLHSEDPRIVNFDIPKLAPGQHYYHYVTMSRINAKTSDEIKGKTWREYAITGYFANCLADGRFGKPSAERTLANLLSYQVFFNKVSLFFHHARPPVKDHLIFSSLNCSIVALCGYAPGSIKSQITERYICGDSRWPKIISAKDPKNRPAFKCYGFGFIRAISPEKKIFYVISPISQEDCAKVEIFFIPDKIITPNYMFDRDVSGLSEMQSQPPIWSNSRTKQNETPRCKIGASVYDNFQQDSRTTQADKMLFAPQIPHNSTPLDLQRRSDVTAEGSTSNFVESSMPKYYKRNE